MTRSLRNTRPIRTRTIKHPARRPVLLVAVATLALLGAVVTGPGLASANPAPPAGMIGATLTGLFDGVSRSGTIAGTITPASFSGSSTSVATPFDFNVACDPSTACASGAGGTVVSITWNFGDGSTCSSAASCAVFPSTPAVTGDLTSVSHNYTTPGAYTVTATIVSTTGYAKASIQALASPRFTDVAAGSGRADREAIWTLAALGLMQGCTSSTFCPEPSGSPDPTGLSVPVTNGITHANCLTGPASTCGLPPSVFSPTNPTASCDSGASTGTCHTALAQPTVAANNCPTTAQNNCNAYPPGQPLYSAPSTASPAGSLTYNPFDCADNYVATKSATGTWSAVPGTPQGCETRGSFIQLAANALDANTKTTNAASVSCPDATSSTSAAYARLNALGVGTASATPVLTRTRSAVAYCDPTAAITKGEAYALVGSAANYTPNPTIGNSVADLAHPDLGAAPASPYTGVVGALLNAGAPLVGSTRCVTNTGTCFNAGDALTRGQAAQLIANMLTGPDRVYGGLAINLSADNTPQQVGASIHLHAQVSIPSYYPSTTVALNWTRSDNRATFTNCTNSVVVAPGQTVAVYCDVQLPYAGSLTITTPATTTVTSGSATTPTLGSSAMAFSTPSVTVSADEVPPDLGTPYGTTGNMGTPFTISVPVYDPDGYNLTYTVSSATAVSTQYPTALSGANFAQTGATPTVAFGASAPTEVGTVAINGPGSSNNLVAVTVTPSTSPQNAYGPFDFTLQACHPSGNASGCSTQVIQGLVYAVNTAPTATALSQTLTTPGVYGPTGSFAGTDSDWGVACYHNALSVSAGAANSDQGVPCPAGVYTTLASATSPGATSLSVNNASQLVPNESMTIGTGASAESVTIATVPSGTGVGTVTITSPTLYAHATSTTLVVTAGIGSYQVTSLPTYGTLQTQTTAGTWVAANTATVTGQAAWRYMPPTDRWGGTQTFNYVANDNGLASAGATATTPGQDSSATSPTATVTETLPAAPAAPSSFVCVAASPAPGQTNLSWSAESDPRVTGYNVYRSLPGGSQSLIGSVSGIGSTSLADSVTATGVNLIGTGTAFSPGNMASAIGADNRTNSYSTSGASHAVVVSGAGNAYAAQTTRSAATAGGQYTGVFQVEGPATQTAAAMLVWYNAGGTLISSSTGTTSSALSTTAYQAVSVTDTAPAGAVTVGVQLLLVNTGGASVAYFDNAQLLPSYTYTVTAYNATGQETAQASPQSCRPTDPIPGSPALTYTVLPTGTSEAANWTAPAYAVYYNVEQHADSGTTTMTGTPTAAYAHDNATTLASAASSGATSLTVTSTAGMAAGKALTLVNGGTSSTTVIQSIAGSVVTVSPGISSAFATAGTTVLTSTWSLAGLGTFAMEDLSVQACNASGCSAWTSPSTLWTLTSDSLNCNVPGYNTSTFSSGQCTQSWGTTGSNASTYNWKTWGSLNNYANYSNPSANTDTIANPTGGGGAGLCNYYSTSTCANGTLTAVYTGSTSSSSNAFTGIMGTQGTASFCSTSANSLGGGACANVQACRTVNVTGSTNCSPVYWSGSSDYPSPGYQDAFNYYASIATNRCYNPGGAYVPYPSYTNLGLGVYGDPTGTYQNQCDYHVEANWTTGFQFAVDIPGNQGFYGTGGQVYCYTHYSNAAGYGCQSNGTAGDWNQAYFAGGWINIQRFSRGDAVGGNRGIASGYNFGVPVAGQNDAEDIIVPEWATTASQVDNIFVAPSNANQCNQSGISSPTYYDGSQQNVCNFMQIQSYMSSGLGSTYDTVTPIASTYANGYPI